MTAKFNLIGLAVIVMFSFASFDSAVAGSKRPMHKQMAQKKMNKQVQRNRQIRRQRTTLSKAPRPARASSCLEPARCKGALVSAINRPVNTGSQTPKSSARKESGIIATELDAGRKGVGAAAGANDPNSLIINLSLGVKSSDTLTGTSVAAAKKPDPVKPTLPNGQYTAPPQGTRMD